ncbi:MAG: sialic acid TRAP transporter substrate-binding protein SiaP [Rhodospirillales bacterium]|jgi:tripartite ATP-independent transporter DctP family solute receptor|nr:sialic acid TRAP transporter substrate-binding protein SiaP [Rhodospirillales bacterium]
MKLRHILGFAGVATAMLITGTVSAAESLKFAHVYETSQPYHKWALWAADELKSRSGGKYEMEVFPASTLGKEVDINEGLSLGTVDIIYTGFQFAGRSYGPMGISGYPYVYASVGHWKNFIASDLFKEMSASFTKVTGHMPVTATYYGQRHVTSKKPISKPADMKDLKIRVPNAPAYTIFPNATGANPTPIAFAEVYLALQQGVVDAQENPMPTIQAKKFYEVQKYINLTGHITDSLLTIVGGPLWNRLGADDQKMLSGILVEASQKCTAEIEQKELDLVAWFEGKGNIVNKKVDVDAMQAATAKFYAANKMPWPTEIWDRLQALK